MITKKKHTSMINKMTSELVAVEYWEQLQLDNLLLVTEKGNRIYWSTFRFVFFRDLGVLSNASECQEEPCVHLLVEYFRDIIDCVSYKQRFGDF